MTEKQRVRGTGHVSLLFLYIARFDVSLELVVEAPCVRDVLQERAADTKKLVDKTHTMTALRRRKAETERRRDGETETETKCERTKAQPQICQLRQRMTERLNMLSSLAAKCKPSRLAMARRSRGESTPVLSSRETRFRFQE